jgi:hypothetical protein
MKANKPKRTALAAKHYRAMMRDNPPASRPYSDPLARIAKAIAYAEWIAARDHITLPQGARGQVRFVPCQWQGFKAPVQVACGVSFDDILIRIPGWSFDPTMAPQLAYVDEAPEFRFALAA